MARGLSPAKGAAAAFTALVLAAGLSGCSGGDGLSLAKQACGHVATSIEMYHSAQHDQAPAQSARELTGAVEQLREALPIAASAAGDSSQWQALMTTLGESTRLPESELANALQAQCQAVDVGS